MMNTERYLEPHQAKRRPSTSFEDLLGDSIERAFGSGITELEPLVEFLNKSGPMAPNGQAWTPALYTLQICALGEQR